MTMDIDSPGTDELSVFMHPLALVHMSDQYTRVRMGGSPLDPKAPVVGILFGKHVAADKNKSNASIFVEDAGDIPLEAAQAQIDLHHAVFPNQHVLGWYKVVGDRDHSEPTAHDLKQTLQIQKLQQQQQKSDGNRASQNTFLGLLQVPKSRSKKTDSKPKAVQPSGDAAMKDSDDDEEELPLTIYRLDDTGNALMAVSTWSLQTAESERIAVQRVIREKAEAAAPAAAAPAQGGDAQSGNTSTTTNDHPVPVESKTLVPYADEVQESCQAIATRLSVVLQYLESLPSPPPPQHLPLLRQVQGLLLQLGPIRATAATSTTHDVDTLQQLAALAKTVDSVTLYAEKFRFLQEHTGGSGSGSGSGRGPSAREMRRGF